SDPRRADALVSLAYAQAELGKGEFVEHAAAAAKAFVARGDREAAAHAESLAANWLWNFGRTDEARAAAARALALVRAPPPSRTTSGASGSVQKRRSTGTTSSSARCPDTVSSRSGTRPGQCSRPREARRRPPRCASGRSSVAEN